MKKEYIIIPTLILYFAFLCGFAGFKIGAAPKHVIDAGFALGLRCGIKAMNGDFGERRGDNGFEILKAAIEFGSKETDGLIDAEYLLKFFEPKDENENRVTTLYSDGPTEIHDNYFFEAKGTK